MVFKEWVFLVLAIMAWTQVDPTIHTVGRGFDIGTQMTKHCVICGAQNKRARHRTAYLVHCPLSRKKIKETSLTQHYRHLSEINYEHKQIKYVTASTHIFITKTREQILPFLFIKLLCPVCRIVKNDMR